MAIIPKPKFPNIPALPGVPQLLRSPIVPTAAIPVLLGGLAVGQLFQALFATTVWGVFDVNGDIVVTPDSVVDFGISNAYNVSTYPIQKGDFRAYNKVANPFEPYIRMTKGGTESDRAGFLADVEGLLNDAQAKGIGDPLPLYTIMTPERAYEQVTLERYELNRRDVKGAFFIDIDLYFKEIRTATPQFVSTQNAQNVAALPAENLLRVQAAVPALGTVFNAATGLAVRP